MSKSPMIIIFYVADQERSKTFYEAFFRSNLWKFFSQADVVNEDL